MPKFANSGSIFGMNIFGARRCRVTATVLVVMTLSWAASAQEPGQLNDAQLDNEPAQPQEITPPRRLFVSDKLVLNVYAEADQSSARVATIDTGDAVDELERSANFVRVRLDNGIEGWVGANYLTLQAPAAVRVRELEREQKTALQAAEKKSADEIARLKKESAALKSQLDALKSTAASAPTAPIDRAMTKTMTAVAVAAPAPEIQQGEVIGESPSVPSVAAGPAMWIWLLIVALAATLGYAAGFRSLDRRLRKKFGGLKLY